MRITKIFVDGKEQWIEIGKRNYYLLDCSIPTASPTRVAKLKKSSLENVQYANPFWGSSIFGLAYNYKSLVGSSEKYDEPLFFVKSVNSACPHKSKVEYPRFIEKVWVEVELVIIIGKKCRNVSSKQVSKYIYGYTIGSDITASNISKRDHHLARSKALDQFAPIGPFIVTDIKPTNLDMSNYINDKLMQQGNTSDRILNDAECVSLLSKFVTLMPGDLIFTGTPAGAMDSLVQPGDTVRHTIEDVGELSFSLV